MKKNKTTKAEAKHPATISNIRRVIEVTIHEADIEYQPGEHNKTKLATLTAFADQHKGHNGFTVTTRYGSVSGVLGGLDSKAINGVVAFMDESAWAVHDNTMKEKATSSHEFSPCERKAEKIREKAAKRVRALKRMAKKKSKPALAKDAPTAQE